MTEYDFASTVRWLIALPDGGNGDAKVLARRAGISSRTVDNWLAGKTPSARVGAAVSSLDAWARATIPDYPPDDGRSLVELVGSYGDEETSTDDADAAVDSRSHSLLRRHRVPLLVGVSIVVAGAAIAAVVVGLADRTTDRHSKGGQHYVESGGPLVAERSDNSAGTHVYSSPAGAPAPASLSTIPYGRTVEVSCRVPDETGAATVTALYLVVGGPWNGLFAVSDTMTNGDPFGQSGGHSVDPRVFACRRR